jgi:hypothetical protein
MITFPELPTELRSKIWLFATQNPRDIEITQYLDATTIIANRIPALLHTCRDSRLIGMEVYQKFNLCIQTVSKKQVMIYFNPFIDVIYFRTEPRLDIMPPILPPPQIHQVKLDTKWIYHGHLTTKLEQFGIVVNLLSHLWQYAKFESVKLIIHEDKDCYLNMDMIEAALKDVHGYNRKIDWELQREYAEESTTRSASTNYLF